MAPPKTKATTPLLSELARHVVSPKGATTTGWPAVEKKCGELGITFRPWQPGVGRLILAKRPDGKYAATIGGTGMSIPRQVGKTFLVGAIVFALCLLNPNLTVIWTAHRLRTAEETFGKMQAFAKRRKIAPHILKMVLGSGEEAIIFRNGSRILFGARESGFGLGFDEVDVLIFDEAQRLKAMTLDDMVPATNQSRQPTSALLLFMGTPPRPTDAGEVFGRMRSEALSGEDDDTGWVEFGADPGFTPTPAPAPLTPADWAQVAKANPSYPLDTPREAILRMRKKLGADSFLREGLGIWDEVKGAGIMPSWSTRIDPKVLMPERLTVALAGSIDGMFASIGAAGMVDDRVVVGAVKRETGQQWVVAEAKRIQDTHEHDVVIDKRGPLAHLIPDLEAAGVRLTLLEQADLANASESFWQAVEGTGLIVHHGHPELDAAVASAAWRSIGDRRAFGRKGGDISMLEAVALAAHHASVEGPSVYEERGLVTL